MSQTKEGGIKARDYKLPKDEEIGITIEDKTIMISRKSAIALGLLEE